jgi:hypothetical protein
LPENNFMADSSTISPTGQSGPEAGGAGLSDATVGIDGLSALGGSIANAGIFDRTDIRDPKEMQQYKRDKILADNSGLRGLVNIAYGKLGLETSADDELKELSQASSDIDTREREEAWRLKGQTEHDQYGHDLRVLREAVAATGRSESQNEQASIDKTYQSEMSEADKLANENWAGAGFSSPRAQNEEVIQFKQNAQLLRQASESKLTNEDREGVFLNDNRLKALQLQASGDSTGARRQELQNQLIGEAVNLDPNDWDAGQRFGKIYNQSMSNFDTDAKRQAGLQAAQSQDQVLGYQEEATEAKLKGEGRDWDASVLALKFATEQRVRTLREEADAVGNNTRKQQLNRQADAAEQTGKIERDAQQQGHARQLAEAQKTQAAQQAPQKQPQPSAQGDACCGAEDKCKSSLEGRSRADHQDPTSLQSAYFSDAVGLIEGYGKRNDQAAAMAALSAGVGLQDSIDLISRPPGNDRGADSAKMAELLAKLDKFFSRGVSLAMVRD